MNKNLALTGLTLFAALVMLTPTITVFAGVAGPVSTPSWYNCIGQYEAVGSTGKAYAGTSNVLVAWIAPQEDAAGLPCINRAFSLIQFTVQIYHQGVATANGPTFQSTSSLSSITVSVIRVVTVCTKNFGCQSHNYPYILLPGDGVCVNEAVFYGIYDGHSGGYCYYV
jgi:hypothetical protein